MPGPGPDAGRGSFGSLPFSTVVLRCLGKHHIGNLLKRHIRGSSLGVSDSSGRAEAQDSTFEPWSSSGPQVDVVPLHPEKA